jgi:hypothetical protein
MQRMQFLLTYNLVDGRPLITFNRSSSLRKCLRNGFEFASYSILIQFRPLQHPTCKRSKYDVIGILTPIRILVLDNGQIIEQGSHEELLSRSDGVFTKMWKAQVGATENASASSTNKGGSPAPAIEEIAIPADDQTTSVPETSLELHAGEADPEATKPVDIPPSVKDIMNEPINDSPSDEPELTVLEGPGQDTDVPIMKAEDSVGDQSNTSVKEADAEPLTDRIEPATEDKRDPEPTTGAISFPIKSDDASSVRESSIGTPVVGTPTATPSVSFSPGVDSPPSRSGTPDPTGEGKRKGLSSQNLQRLARRISLVGRRGSSSGLSGTAGVSGSASGEGVESESAEGGKKGKKSKKKKSVG